MEVKEKFIAIDGPNGIGKTTIVKLLARHQYLGSVGDILFTKEPTITSLGMFIRNNHADYLGRSLAALVAADRYDHIESSIIPNLTAGKTVISDRYLASSLVYQIIDGVPYDLVWALNQDIILPGLYFILIAEPATISERLRSRGTIERFENEDMVEKEVNLFMTAGNLLNEKGVVVRFIRNEHKSVAQTTDEIALQIKSYLET
jgi:dTMP kinase